MGKITSYTSASGMRTRHYDENGKMVGESWTSRGGRTVHYDADGNKTGESYKNKHGHMTHYDQSGKKTGYSQVMKSGQVKHYDTHYNRTGESNQNFWNAHVTEDPNQSSGSSGSNDHFEPVIDDTSWDTVIAIWLLLFLVIGCLLLLVSCMASI